MTARITSVSHGAWGSVLWLTTRGDYVWNGAGSRLRMIVGSGTDASLIMIDHPVACGSYESESEATAALQRFLAEFSGDVGEPS